MKSVCVQKPGILEIIDIREPSPGPYEVRIRSEVSYICNATDRKLIDGHFPGMEHPRNYPLLLGHETAGIVEEVGEGVRNLHIGDRVISGLLLTPPESGFVSGWGGMSEYVIAKDHDAMVVDGKTTADQGYDEVYKIMKKVPADIPVEAAGLLCTWREVLAGFRDFGLKGNESLLVFGAGPVGLSFVKLAKLLGFPFVASVDPIPSKRLLAKSFGADEVFEPDTNALSDCVKLRSRPFDAVIDAVGDQKIIQAGLAMIGMAGKICVYGVIDTPVVQIDKSRGPYNFNLLVHQWPTRDYECQAQERLCDWIRAGELEYRDFLSAEYPVGKAIAAFAEAATGRHIKTMLRW
jgi:threonine dehydrogenase-like Zn-dependent dehydrogenase